MLFIERLRIRTRLLIAVLVPVLTTAVVIGWITMNTLQEQGAREIAMLEQELMSSRKEGLVELVHTARSVAVAVMNDPDLSEQEAKTEARNRVRAIDFGANNYVFLFGRDYSNLAFRPDPSIEEAIVEDESQRQLMAALFAAADGDGFIQYEWLNPSTDSDEMELKVSYIANIRQWNWVIGAGVYVGDIQVAIDRAQEKVDESVRAALTFIAIAALVVTLVALVCGMLVGQTVTRPIKRVSNLMLDISKGEGDLTHRLPADGTDELAEVGRSFNAFVARIQKTIQEVSATTEQVASAAEELSRVAKETRESVDIQGSETDQIASAINQMAATIQQISSNASEVESAASDADRMAQEGGQTIASAQQSVNTLAGDIDSSTRNIKALAAKTGEIEKVLDVIHEVTDQTNLLALNAAIEAARAGEHGRGFAVVADEVRQLARRSAESADQIRTMIEGFVSETKRAVDNMETSSKRTSETVDRTEHAAGSLRTIVTSVSAIHEQVTQIAAAAEEQSSVAEEINKNVVRIVEAAQSSGSGVSQTSEASNELAQLSERLRSLVGQFRT